VRAAEVAALLAELHAASVDIDALDPGPTDLTPAGVDLDDLAALAVDLEHFAALDAHPWRTALADAARTLTEIDHHHQAHAHHRPDVNPPPVNGSPPVNQ
jgi:hypothetical protein